MNINNEYNLRRTGGRAGTYLYYFYIYMSILIWGFIYMYKRAKESKRIKELLVGFHSLIFVNCFRRVIL
jgi:hypothetical protein